MNTQYFCFVEVTHGPCRGIQQSICGAQPTSFVRNVAHQVLQVSTLHDKLELVMWVKPAFSIHRNGWQGDQMVGQVIGKEVHLVSKLYLPAFL